MSEPSANQALATDEFLMVRKGIAPGARVDTRNDAMLALGRIEDQLAVAVTALRKSQGHVPYFGRHTETVWCERCGPSTPWPCAQTSDEAKLIVKVEASLSAVEHGESQAPKRLEAASAIGERYVFQRDRTRKGRR